MLATLASLLLGSAIAGIATGCGAETPPPVVAPADWAAPGVDGVEVSVLAGAEATVLLFVATACPISNRYAPEIRRLAEGYAAQGVRFLLVYPDGEDTADAIRRHRVDFALPAVALRDPELALARVAGVEVTPEAAVFDAAGVRRYRGRIDDRVLDFGKARPQPTRRDLADALDAVLRGEPVAEPARPAVGCAIPGLS